MSGLVYFVTHPDVLVDPAVPVPEWSLSERGVMRMRAALAKPWLRGLSGVYASRERKSLEGAQLLADAARLQVQVHPELAEVDRSATGYLPHAEHEATADLMFAHTDESARGWETARAAQSRIVRVVSEIVAADSSSGTLAIVSHGAVGAFLLCHLANYAIHRKHDQPGTGGGNYFAFDRHLKLVHGWQRLD